MRQPGSDVVIVGGGLMGAATAFFLRRRGRSVTLLEQGMVGQFASGTNFGNVRRPRFITSRSRSRTTMSCWLCATPSNAVG